jgi:hypothetical protein
VKDCTVPAIIAALCFRGGLVLLGFGVSVVRKDGRRASRIRLFWRSLLTWVAPLILAQIVYILVVIVEGPVEPAAASVPGLLVTGCLIACLTAWSTLLPDRGIPDRLSGTRMVLR